MRSSKLIKIIVIAVVVFFAILWVADIMLYPCTFMRNDVHKVTSEKMDVVIMGTSNGKMGIDPDYLLSGTDLKGHNICVGGEYPVDAYYLTKLIKEKQDVKTIIFDVDPGYFTTEKEKGNNYLLFWHEFPISLSKIEYSAATLKDSDMRALLFPFYEYPLKTTTSRIGDNINKKLGNDYSIESLKSSAQEYHENGFIEKYPVSEKDFPAFDPELFIEEEVKETNIEYLKKLIDYCKKNDIEFIASSMPLPDYALNECKENFDEAWAYFEDFFKEQNVVYYNFNTDYYKSYSHLASHYVDYDGHMNGDSAREFSGIFGKILKYHE